MKKLLPFLPLLLLIMALSACAPQNPIKTKENRPNKVSTSEASKAVEGSNLDLEFSSIKELLLIIKNETHLKCTEFSKSSFTWIRENGNYSTLPCWEIFANIKTSGDLSEIKELSRQITGIISSRGFDEDPANTTEITIGFKKGNIGCLILTPWANSANGETSYPLKVQCGFIK